MWGADPGGGMRAVVLPLYGDENNLIQPFEITSLATEKSELVKCEYYSIRKWFLQKLFGRGLKRYKV